MTLDKPWTIKTDQRQLQAVRLPNVPRADIRCSARAQTQTFSFTEKMPQCSLLCFLFFLSLTVTLAVRRGCFPLLSVRINTLLSTTSTKTYMYIKKSLGWELGEMDVQLIAAGLGCHRTSTAASVASGSTPVVCGIWPSPTLCYQI